MRTERAMTSRIHCTVASSEHNQEESKLNKKTALPILFVSLSCTCFRGGGKGRGKGDRREGGREEEERDMEKNQKYIFLGAPTWQLHHVQRECRRG